VIRDIGRLTAETRNRWTKPAFIVPVTRERTVISADKSSIEPAYYIGINPKDAARRITRFIRSLGGIENSLHDVLEVAFQERNSQNRTKNRAANLITLRYMVTGLLKFETTCKLSSPINARRRGGTATICCGCCMASQWMPVRTGLPCYCINACLANRSN